MDRIFTLHYVAISLFYLTVARDSQINTSGNNGKRHKQAKEALATPATNSENKTRPKPGRENVWMNILFNIVIPSIILMKLSKPDRLGPVISLIIAISFPLVYCISDLIRSRKWNFFSIIGLFNTSLTGGFSLMQLNGFWFAIKGATEPLLFALATIISLRTRYPLVKTILMNPSVMNVSLIQEKINSGGVQKEFNALLVKCTYLVASSFLVSMITHFSLAITILKSNPGTPEFNNELGLMTSLGFPVNVLPAMLFLGAALWYLFSGLKKLTSLEFTDIVIDHEAEKKESA